MERLTKSVAGQIVPTKFNNDFILTMKSRDYEGYCEAMERLSAYEDTCMTPEEIHQLADKLEAATPYKAFFEDLVGGEKLSEALTLYRGLILDYLNDELIIPHPATKDGDPKPRCFYADFYGAIWCLGLGASEGDEPIEKCKGCWYNENFQYEREAEVGGRK